MIREREGSKGIRFIIVFFFAAIFFFAVGFIVNKWFFAKEGPKSPALSTDKEAALRKTELDKKNDDVRSKNPIVGEEKEDFTFYKTLKNGKEPLPLKQQKKEEGKQKTEVKSQKAEKAENSGQKKENTESTSQKTEEKKHKAEDKGDKSRVKNQELGITKKTVNAKEKLVKKSTKHESSAKEKKFTLQVAAFKEREKAEDIAASLKKRGYDPYIIPVTIPEKGVWYRVRIGRFATRPDAQNIQTKLKKSESINSFITFTTE